MKERLTRELKRLRHEFQNAVNAYGKDKIIIYLYLIFSLIAITVFGLFAIRPTLATISELHKEKADSKETLDKMTEKNQNLQILAAHYQQIQSKLETVYRAIPTSPKIPELTRKIEVLANRNNLAIQSLSTGAIELYPAVRANSSLFSYTVTINVLGDESDINTFTQEFISFDRLISIDRITSGSAERGLFSATITGRAFFIKE